jgi:hypothetical protein
MRVSELIRQLQAVEAKMPRAEVLIVTAPLVQDVGAVYCSADIPADVPEDQRPAQDEIYIMLRAIREGMDPLAPSFLMDLCYADAPGS